jgi:hypothetical protein
VEHLGRLVISDLPGVPAELVRLYELMRCDPEMERHAYARSLTGHLETIATSLQVSELEECMRSIEVRLGKTKRRIK